MIRQANVFARAVLPYARRNASRWPAMRQCAIAIVAAGLLAGCAGSVAMQNPRTGATATCAGTFRELNPWSQTMACVADYEAKGWVRVSRE